MFSCFVSVVGISLEGHCTFVIKVLIGAAKSLLYTLVLLLSTAKKHNSLLMLQCTSRPGADCHVVQCKLKGEQQCMLYFV